MTPNAASSSTNASTETRTAARNGLLARTIGPVPQSEVESIKQRGGGNWNGVLARVLTRQHVRAVYQPILHLESRSVAGYEALARPANVADDGSVEEFFRSARQQGVTRDLEWLCRRAALDAARGMDPGAFLSLNLNPDVLQNAQADAEALMQLVEAAGRDVSSVVIEVVRPPAVADAAALMALLAPYRRAGARIALAGLDAADEPSLLASITQPDFIKLSRAAVAAFSDPVRRDFATRCATRAAGGGPIPIAEGIELEETAEMVAGAGITLGQGYHLGRPATMDRDGHLFVEPPPQPAVNGLV